MPDLEIVFQTLVFASIIGFIFVCFRIIFSNHPITECRGSFRGHLVSTEDHCGNETRRDTMISPDNDIDMNSSKKTQNELLQRDLSADNSFRNSVCSSFMITAEDLIEMKSKLKPLFDTDRFHSSGKDRAQSLDSSNIRLSDKALTPHQHISVSSGQNLRRKVMFIVNEILASEQAYVTFLETVVMLYVNPLQKIWKPQRHESVFANLQEIFIYHQYHVYPDFRQIVLHKYDVFRDENRSPNSPKTLGHAFMPFLERWMDMYSRYISNFESAQLVLESLSKSKKLRRVVGQAQLDPRHTLPNLQYYLIMPVQRLPRYRLLLEELCNTIQDDQLYSEKCVDKEWSCIVDLDTTRQALEGVNSLISSINSNLLSRKLRRISKFF